jgi:DNA-binding NtrC family response regulator
VTRLSPSGQGALLRVVEERRVTRLGGTTGTDVRARLIASSDVDVEDAVHDGTLRTDLFHRLSVLPVKIPPLRERVDDVLPLARAYLTEVAAQLNRDAPTIATDAEDALTRYHWPGNVRELRHVLERVMLAGVGRNIGADALPMEVLEGNESYLAPGTGPRPTLEEVERRYIELTLTYARGNQTRAAAILGISRKALWEKRKRYGLR